MAYGEDVKWLEIILCTCKYSTYVLFFFSSERPALVLSVNWPRDSNCIASTSHIELPAQKLRRVCDRVGAITCSLSAATAASPTLACRDLAGVNHLDSRRRGASSWDGLIQFWRCLPVIQIGSAHLHTSMSGILVGVCGVNSQNLTEALGSKMGPSPYLRNQF